MPSHSPRQLLAAATLSLAAGAAVFGACTITQEQPNLWGQDLSLTILHTTDIHSRLLPYTFQPLKTDQDLGLRADAPPYGGIARLATLLKRERTKAQRSIHLDSGDCFQGAPIFNAWDGEVEMRWLSHVGADAVVVGNHEFDAGVRNLAKQYAAWGKYPLLAANYDWYDWRDPRYTELGKLTQPFAIINANGLRIGVIGMANVSSLNSIVEENNSLQAAPLEPNETLRTYVEYLGPQVDLIGITSHLGLGEDAELIRGYEAVYLEDEIKPYLERDYDPWRIVEKLTDGKVLVHIPGVRRLDFIAGGHLHVVTNPPQVIEDVEGRRVPLFHSGAFAKYLGRFDAVVRMPAVNPEEIEDRAEQLIAKAYGAEIVAHDYYAFPLDAAWCADHRTTPELSVDADPAQAEAFLAEARGLCASQEDADTLRILDPYVLSLLQEFDLPRIFAYAPREILRRNSSTGGDAPLGNMTAEAMRVRRGVEAEFSVTNTLGIRDSLYRGPVTIESMFNIFPFENTINIMYLSGTEVQQVLDFVGERSAGRGCNSQAQIAGVRFVMDCGQVLRNREERPCTKAAECGRAGDPDDVAWECRDEVCWAHSALDITMNGEPLNAYTSYKLATNDYIAKGGSGFRVLKRNTTRVETGISLRDGLIQFMKENYCTCDQLLGADAAEVLRSCPRNAVEDEGVRQIDPLALDFCNTAVAFEELLSSEQPDLLAESAPRIFAGKCDCNDILADTGDASADEERVTKTCGHVTSDLRDFCKAPTNHPIVTGVEDDRIERRIQ